MMRIVPFLIAIPAFVACGGGSSEPSCSPTALDGVCDSGQTCLDGACVADGTLCTPSNPTGACSSGKTCVSGTCYTDAQRCSDTNPTGACQSSYSCFEGDCTLTSSLCPQDPAGLCPSGKVCDGTACIIPANECDKAANIAHRNALIAAQPTFDTRSKTITAQASFASLADDASVTCTVSLKFRDANRNDTLEPYEDWTLTSDERVTDLLGRMTVEEQAALMAHPTLTDAPTAAASGVSPATQAHIASGIRFGLTKAITSTVAPRATWANNLQAACETTGLGIPFVLSAEPASSIGGGRTLAKGFKQWPTELGLAASGRPAVVEGFGQWLNQDYRALGIRMALSVPADLATDARWFNGQFTFGEDSAAVADFVEAYVLGLQGAELGRTSVAAVVKSFPGAGAAKDGWDARLQKGKWLTYPGDAFDAHLAAFEKAFAASVAGVMPAYGIPEAGPWTALSGAIDGSTIEQVGASFNPTIIGDILRTHYAYEGLVLAPWGILEDAAVSPLGTPWGMEANTRVERLAAAVNAGVDQFGGLDSRQPVLDARTAGSITTGQIAAAAGRALWLEFALGLFENPYVDATQAIAKVGSDGEYQASLAALRQAMVLLTNALKPDNWLNGEGDGTQVGDAGNAGNGSGRILPAPKGVPYGTPGCAYYTLPSLNETYVGTYYTGYGEWTNNATDIGQTRAVKCHATTAEERVACSDYVMLRIKSPSSVDPDSGSLALPPEALDYAGNGGAAGPLAELAWARAAIDASSTSQTQIVVGIDAGRLPLLAEILAYEPAAIYIEWYGPTNNELEAKTFMDIAFGIFDGKGKLPVGIPSSNTDVQASDEDLAGDGQDPTLIRGYGFETKAF